MIDLAAFRARLASWEGPLGPFREPEHITADMERAIAELGEGAAGALADLVCALEREGAPERDALADFLDLYARRHPEALARALLERLSPAGPPLLVAMLGPTGHRDAVPRLTAAIDPGAASEELLVALAGALGELGGGAAIEALRRLQAREDLTAPARREVEIALGNHRA